MAFKTGTVTNSHQLVHEVLGVLTDIGWKKHAVLQADAQDQDGYDIVFYSTGKNNDKDIYIRIAAGIGDTRTVTGDIQFPFDDGYNGYVNGFAYQYFPSNGTSGDDGYNELGYYGPILYSNIDAITEVSTSFDDGDAFKTNLFNISPPNAPRATNIFDASVRSGTFDPNSAGAITTFDGKQGLYCGDNSSSITGKINIYDGSFTNISSAFTGYESPRHVYLKKWFSDGEFIYGPGFRSISNVRFFWNRYSLQTDSHDVLSSPPSINFGNSSTWRSVSQAGTMRKKFIDGQPGHRLIYVLAGWSNNNTNSFANRWLYYNAETENWDDNFATPNLPFAAMDNPSFGNSAMTFALKESTGYEHDRLYITRSDAERGFASIAIGDDGYSVGSWTVHANTPDVQRRGFHIRHSGKAIFMTPGELVSVDNGAVYRWALPENPTDSGSWELIGTGFIEGNANNGHFFEIHNHLCNRVRLTENQTNTYWIFADLERIIVVVKTPGGDYNYIYTGLYDSYLLTDTVTLTQDANEGDFSLQVSNASTFKIGQKYLIVDSQGTGKKITGYDLSTRVLAPSEIFTVTNIAGNTLITNRIVSDYKAGSKIAEDPLPLMVRVHSLERALTLNNVSLDRDDDYTDPPFQDYSIKPLVISSVSDVASNANRSGEIFLFPITLSNPGIDGVVGNEIRGQLRGVFATGTGVSSEDILKVGADDYIVFDIEESQQTERVVMGPMK